MEFFDKQIKAEDLIGMPETLKQMKKNLAKQQRTKG